MAHLPEILTIPLDGVAHGVIRLDEAARGRSRDELAAAMRERLPELACELLGRPTMRSGREWRWGRHGSLSLVMSGTNAGQWFDHEAGQGGGFVDLIARELRSNRRGACAWAAERTGLAPHSRPAAVPARRAAKQEQAVLLDPPVNEEEARTERARRAAEATWRLAAPASDDHPYLQRKGVGPHGLRCDRAGRLIVPLCDLDGVLYTVEFIAEDGSKRYLAGGAKAGHFCLIGGPLDGAQTILACGSAFQMPPSPSSPITTRNRIVTTIPASRRQPRRPGRSAPASPFRRRRAMPMISPPLAVLRLSTG